MQLSNESLDIYGLDVAVAFMCEVGVLFFLGTPAPSYSPNTSMLA